ncbi:MAG TPA: ankyrin repeat domain-containing protein [Bacteroidia bacterium]|jgi:ankyrin repeat protein|nr:ankyrin repeat domain-containing protein [Bacteroidia bacterium]
MTSQIIGILLLMFNCTNRDTIVDKSKLLGVDYRLFQDTPAWELAKAVRDGDTDKIKFDVSKNKTLLSFREPRLGHPLLEMAVMNKNYPSVKMLLELGADPNMQDLDLGESPLMAAANIGIGTVGSDVRFLKLLLQYGGDPNLEENGPQKQGGKRTPLLIACSGGNLDYVKTLVNAGAKINAVNEYDMSPLSEAMIYVAENNPDIVIYLLQKGVDFKRPLYKTVPEGENKYITDALREWRFDLGSNDYKKKMQIVAFLKKNGMDYWKTKIPEQFLDLYPKAYLEKY